MNYSSDSTIKSRNLIIGCDFAALHSYLRNCTQENVLGFVYCLESKPPITHFKGPSTDIIRIYPLDELENCIRDLNIQKCEMQVRGLSMSAIQSITNRIMSTGSCSIEFFPPRKYSFTSCKPVIAITSLAPKIGKSQLARYFCSVLRNLNTKVSVIIPIIEIDKYNGVFSVKQGPHYEFKENDPIPFGIFSDDDELLIKNYQKAGAIRIYATSDYEKAIIIAEQHSDIIIFDAKGCEYPTISVTSHSAFPPKSEDKSSEKKNEKRKYEKFCVINEETLLNIDDKTLWPGIFNLQSASNVVIILSSKNPILNQDNYKNILEGKTIYYANLHLIDQEETDSSTEIENDNNNNNDEDEEYDEFPQESASQQTNLEYIIVPRPNENDEYIFYDSNTINDIDYNLFQYLVRYSPEDYIPPLKNHFEAQVDILTKMANASLHELRDNNNDSANRETLCRLFLESHLPPNFRITSGEIIDSFSNGTGQLDVVIATGDCPIMTMNLCSPVIAPILADNVLGVIEVKTSLNRDSLKKALTQLRPVKALMPIHSTLKTPDGKYKDDPLDGKIVTGIFSFEINKNTNDIENFLSDYQGVVDFIVIPEKFGIFWEKTLRVCGISTNESTVKNGYVKYMQRGAGLALMFGILNTLAATRGFTASNTIRYLGGFWGGIEEKILNIKNEAILILQNAISIIMNNGKSKQENKACLKEISSMIYNLQKDKASIDDIDESGNIRLTKRNSSNRSNVSMESNDNDNDTDNDNDNDN